MGVTQVVILRVGTGGAQVDGAEWNRCTKRIRGFDDVGAIVYQGFILEEIVGGAIFLEDHHDVLKDGSG
jgi:hypothetical protein